ncbi:hypothetical protein KBA73_01080 [Patescibacteria group bacterium]|nr:hypothetical protein [Patescibacteria group bacterium]
MARENRSFLRAMLAMTGTIVGAGVFGLPAVFHHIGLFWGTVLYVGLACVVAAMHLLYVEIHLVTEHSYRLGGFAKRILGPLFGTITSITYPVHIMGTNLIYILLGGAFVASLLQAAQSGFSVMLVQICYWAVVALMVYKGLRSMAKWEAIATWILIALLFVVSVMGLYSGWHSAPQLMFAWNGAKIPLGILLFSLTGLPAVGEVVELVNRDRLKAYRAVVGGTLLAAALSWFFGITWAMALYPLDATAIGVQIPTVMRSVAWLVPLVGFFAIITSHLTSATDLMAIFQRDHGWKKHYAWAGAVMPPIILFFLVRQNVLVLMDAMGGVFSAFNAAMVCLMALTLAIRSPQRSNWLIGVSALISGALFIAVIIQKLSGFLVPTL